MIFQHYKELNKIASEALGKFDPNIADDIPGFCRPNKKKKVTE